MGGAKIHQSSIALTVQRPRLNEVKAARKGQGRTIEVLARRVLVVAGPALVRPTLSLLRLVGCVGWKVGRAVCLRQCPGYECEAEKGPIAEHHEKIGTRGETGERRKGEGVRGGVRGGTEEVSPVD